MNTPTDLQSNNSKFRQLNWKISISNKFTEESVLYGALKRVCRTLPVGLHDNIMVGIGNWMIDNLDFLQHVFLFYTGKAINK